MKNQSCCFTGHRNIPADQYPVIQKRLDEVIVNLIHQGVCCFYAGGALGFDTMAALAVLNLKAEYSHIRLILVLPCREQAKRWGRDDQDIYCQILSRADEVIYTSERYFPGCMQKRNRQLVDSSGICVCYLTELTGGTAYTVRYAKQKDLKILNIN